MKINVETIDITTVATPALVVNLFSGVEKPGGATGAVDQSLDICTSTGRYQAPDRRR